MQVDALEALQKLVSQVEQLEMELGRFKTPLKPKNLTKTKPVVCCTCGQHGHFAKGCVFVSKRSQIKKSITKYANNTINQQHVLNLKFLALQYQYVC